MKGSARYTKIVEWSDTDQHGQVVGVEFLGIHARTTEQELTSLHFETT
jgi:uncharacterized protein YuzE